MAINNYASLHGSTAFNGFNGNPNQEWLNRSAIPTLEETLLFYYYCQDPIKKDGYATHSFFQVEKITGDPTDVTTASSNPSDTDVNIATKSVTPKEYGYVGTYNHNVERFNVMDVMRAGGMALGNAMGRYLDKLIQKTMTDPIATGTPTAADLTRNARYLVKSGQTAITAINSYTSTNVRNLAMTDLARMAGLLRSRSVPEFGSQGYVCIMSHEVAFDLMTATPANSLNWNTFVQQTPVGVQRIFNGYLGKVFGLTVYQNSHIQTFASTGTGTPTIHPTFFIGMGAIGALKWDFKGHYVSPENKSVGNPIALFGKIGCTMTFNSLILQPDSYVVAFSGATTL